MRGLQLIATGGAKPGRVVTNEELSHQVDTSDAWITTRTGIRQRRYCTDEEDAATLAIAAARQALARSGLAPEDIVCCVAATLSSPTAAPSVACRVQAALHLPENRPAFDVNAACTGFLYAAAAAHGLLATLGGRYALVIGCEALSRLTDPADRSTCVLFGDGAGAAILELNDTAPFAVMLGARGSDAIRVGGVSARDTAPITMDGRAVFRFAVEALPHCLHTVLDQTNQTLDDLDWVVCHQANSRILDHCIKQLNADPAKFYKNIDRYGNTSAASIPLALHEMSESGLLQPGQQLACIGFACCLLIKVEKMKLLNEILGTKYPIIQGGMANIATGEFAAACSNAGALGLIGAGGMNPETLRENIRQCRRLTDKPFGVNIMLMHPQADEFAQIVIDEGVKIVTTGAGNPGKYMAAWKAAGITVIPVVAAAVLARHLAPLGIDAVIAEGTESGGHVGEMTTMALVPQVVDAVDLPVIAAGGIADGRGLAAALALGACGVQVGTCLLTSTECPIHENYKDALLKARDSDTIVTGRLGGTPVRVLKNRMSREYVRQEKAGADKAALEQFTLGSLRKAVFDGDTVNGSLMAGQAAGLLHEVRPVAQILDEMVSGARQCLATLTL